MWGIFASLVFGIFIGRLNILPKRFAKNSNKITMLALAILLFAMGLSIGHNQEIFAQLNQMGLKALFIALFSILGSVLVLWFLQRKVFRSEED